MDASRKPDKKNPRKSANLFSQILFCWAIPLLLKGSREGLNTNDLTNCLKEDKSSDLGDKLEKQWYKEVNKAEKKGREPLLRNAMFRTFWKSCVLDGLIVFIYVMIKSSIPVILAQLLLQFQQPIVLIEENTNELILPSSASDKFIFHNRSVRSSSNLPSNLNKISEDEKIKENTTQTENSFDIMENILSNLNYFWNDVYCLASFVVLSTLFCCFILHHVDLRQKLLGARMRIACCSLIYRKTLKLSKKAAGQTPAGYLINLLSNDVGRLDYGFIFMHFIWILPIQSCLICYLIWRKIGIASVVGVIGLLLKTVPVQTGLSRLSSILRWKIAEKTDHRVGIMNEIVQGIQVIKMYAWEIPFQEVVAESRRREIKQIRYASYLRGFYLSTMVFTERSTLFITIAACVFFSVPITADVVFSMAQFFNILQLVAAIWYPLAISFGAEALVSLTRIQDYLLMGDHDDNGRGITITPHTHLDDDANKNAILLKNITANWNENQRNTLQEINLEVKTGQLCAIIGPVGSGKSSLLHLLLGELPIDDGSVIINGNLSFASQEPWLFTGTVQDNILFGETYNKKRYHEVTKCCALSEDFRQLANGDKTIVGERGTSLSGGQRARISLARAVYKPSSIYLLDDPLSAVDSHVGRHLFDEVIGPKGRLAKEGATRLLVTHQVHFLKEADWVCIIESGKILRQGTYNDLANSELDFAKLLQKSEENEKEVVENFDNFCDNEDIPFIDGVNGYFPLRLRSKSSTSSFNKSLSIEAEMDQDLAEEKADGGVSYKVWIKYFRAGGSIYLLLTMFLVLIISQIVASGSDYFVNIWTQQEYLRTNGQETIFTTNECLYIYGILIIGVVLVTILRGYLFFNICMRASKCLHNKMFESILHATMRFFDTNSSGRILNRFSKDMGAIDEFLPRSMMDFIQISLFMFGILIVISIINPILLAALAIATIIYFLILKLYLRPSQDLKRLEGIAKSPVFSHLSATLTGISTIRARKLQKRVILEFDALQNVHSAVWQLTMSANTALGLWLDCISCAFLASVSFSFILMHQNTFSGNVGLAISQAMILTGMVQYGVRQIAESLQQMTSVERVLEYTALDQETKNDLHPPVDWPKYGKICLKNMSLRYDIDSPAILKNLNIIINPGWKIGIVGRTGAGKSSLISALFRLSYITGDIIIDDIDTSTINLQILRSKISIIPQDPVLFSATIRYNLDPFKKFTDDDLWRALTEVELKQSIENLDFLVTERGSNFSVGQRQLICLARAILRNNKILVLDEATANVDPQTDALIQKTIREKFKECTVLTVAHRLHTVMDSNRILVMDTGSAKEFDIPHVLLQQKDSLLSQMVEATGINESESLKKAAHDAFNRMKILASNKL